MHWKDFFYFTRKERLGIFSLILVILVLSLLLWLIPLTWVESSTQSALAFQKEYESFISHRAFILDSIQHSKQHSKTLRPFNPNTASESQLIHAGLSTKQAKNIINYRLKGGTFKTKSALKKLYTISDSTYSKLKNYIQLPDEVTYQTKTPAPSLFKSSPKVAVPPSVKFTEPTLLSLNQVDTINLKKIPGIGSYLAKRITNYRSRLGGYYSIQQLDEINIDSSQLKDWLTANPSEIQPIPINHTEFKSALKHPYLNYEQVKAIFNYKRKHGRIESIKQLQFLEEFSAQDIDRLSYYLSFN